MQNPQLIHTFPNGQLLYLCDPDPVASISLGLGPHLLIDPYLLLNEGFSRAVYQPVRSRTTPIMQGTLGNDLFRVANYSASVVAGTDGLYRMWFQGLPGGVLLNGMTTSSDGLVWSAPVWCTGLDQYAEISGVLDEGVGANPRYKTVLRDIPTTQSAESLWGSQDGIAWVKVNQLNPNPYGETASLFHLPQGYGLLHRWNIPGYSWHDSTNVAHTNTARNPFARAIGFMQSLDGVTYPNSVDTFSAGTEDDGETQMYYVSNIIKRGSTYIGLLGYIREDITVSGPGLPAGAFGTGWTALIYSGDGINWNRYVGDAYLDPAFFTPSPLATDWDHAMAWINGIVEVGSSVWLYYGGYQWGHKVNTDRQIGLVKIKQDRWVARHAGATTVLRTKLVNFNAQVLTLNSTGQIRVQISDSSGNPIPGFAYSDCQTIQGDNLNAPVVSVGKLSSLANRPVFLEFELTNADLYAFYLS